MVAEYFGRHGFTEQSIAQAMQIRAPAGNEKGLYGTSTRQLVAFFSREGFRVQSSLGRQKPLSFEKFEDFKAWALLHLKQGLPIMVEWIDWGGHWQVIIGYDTMGTSSPEDDVLVFADPCDLTDHCCDGYYVFGAARFFSMWFDARFFNDNEAAQQWVIAQTKGGN